MHQITAQSLKTNTCFASTTPGGTVMSHRLQKTIIASCLLLSSAHVISAEDNPIAREMFDETSAMIDFELKGNNLHNIIVNVSGPRGFAKRQYFD